MAKLVIKLLIRSEIFCNNESIVEVPRRYFYIKKKKGKKKEEEK